MYSSRSNSTLCVAGVLMDLCVYDMEVVVCREVGIIPTMRNILNTTRVSSDDYPTTEKTSIFVYVS